MSEGEELSLCIYSEDEDINKYELSEILGVIEDYRMKSMKVMTFWRIVDTLKK